MVKKAYSLETKLASIEMKKAGKSTKVIMETLGVKIKVKFILGGNGTKMMNSIAFTSRLGNSIATEKRGRNYLNWVN